MRLLLVASTSIAQPFLACNIDLIRAIVRCEMVLWCGALFIAAAVKPAGRPTRGKCRGSPELVEA
jgi:hypothetical protein